MDIKRLVDGSGIENTMLLNNARYYNTCGLFDKLGVFHANQMSMCLDPHLN